MNSTTMSQEMLLRSAVVCSTVMPRVMAMKDNDSVHVLAPAADRTGQLTSEKFDCRIWEPIHGGAMAHGRPALTVMPPDTSIPGPSCKTTTSLSDSFQLNLLPLGPPVHLPRRNDDP